MQNKKINISAFKPLPNIRKDMEVSIDYWSAKRINDSFVSYVRMLEQQKDEIEELEKLVEELQEKIKDLNNEK